MYLQHTINFNTTNTVSLVLNLKWLHIQGCPAKTKQVISRENIILEKIARTRKFYIRGGNIVCINIQKMYRSSTSTPE